MTDPFDRLVALRPAVPDEHGWAESADGLNVLARVQATAPAKAPWWKRRRYIVPTIVIGIGVGVAGGVAFAPAGRQAATDVVCLDRTSDGSPSMSQTVMPIDTDHAQIVAHCNMERVKVDHPAATDFALCVLPATRNQDGGAAVAVPSDVTVTTTNEPTICQAAGYEPIR